MTNINFNYWLQGHFELLPVVVSMNYDQVRIIREHLELVKKHEGLTGFASWLEGYLDGINGVVNQAEAQLIATKLSESFAHVDPSNSWVARTLARSGTYSDPGFTIC